MSWAHLAGLDRVRCGAVSVQPLCSSASCGLIPDRVAVLQMIWPPLAALVMAEQCSATVPTTSRLRLMRSTCIPAELVTCKCSPVG